MTLLTRRDAVFGGSALLLTAAQAQAAQPLRPTPAQTEGPYYPDRMPAETDPDLVRLTARMRDSGGEILDLTGRVLDTAGRPIRDAMVEIWQTDANGRYIHTYDAARGGSDPLFQGFGRTKVDAEGRYAFRTIRPVPYGARTPHIHYKIYRGRNEVLTTQMLVAGERLNTRDGVFRRLDAGERSLVLAELTRSPRAGFDWRTTFDVVLG